MSIFFAKEPLVLNTVLAEKVGLNEAIVLQQLHYWLQRSPHEHDGKLWVYNTYAEWQKQFPWWSDTTIKRIFTALEKSGYVESGNFNKAAFDKTKWYTVNYSTFAYDPIEQVKMTRREGQNDPLEEVNMTRPIPETTQRLTTEITKTYDDDGQDIPKSKEKKIKYAEFVSMTETEYNKLVSEYGEEFTKRAITILDNYKGANGKKYKSDYRAMLNWVVGRVVEETKRGVGRGQHQPVPSSTKQVTGGKIGWLNKPADYKPIDVADMPDVQ